MKVYVKSLTVFVLCLFLGAAAYGFSGDIEIGIDVWDFEESVKTKDFYEPYVAYHLYPVEGSALFVKGRSSYRDQYNKDLSDDRQRHQIYMGYKWSRGNFSFEPAVGVRSESFDNSKLEDRNELRFVPTMTYRFNRKLQWYFTGYVGYMNVDGQETNNKGEVIEEYENQRIRNLATGFRYRFTNKLRLDTAVQHKKREEFQGQYFSTIYRTRLNYDVYRNVKTKVTLNGQIVYMPEVETNKNGSTEDNEFVYRVGFTASHELMRDLELIAKFYYQWRPQNENSGGNNNGGSGGGGNSTPDRTTEHEQFYSVGLRYYF